MNKVIALSAILMLSLTYKIGINAMSQDNFLSSRLQMVESQLKARGIKDRRVLEAMQTIPRDLFVPVNMRKYAYEDRPLDIGYSQTISQPYIVAFMTEMAELEPTYRVLEIGTGSGYQTSILSQLCEEVYTIELVKELGIQAKAQLKELGYSNVQALIGDGYNGWPEKAPFDVIIVTAAPKDLPVKLIEQLKEGGRLIIPIGGLFDQELMRITRTKEGIVRESLLSVRFVPMVKE